MHIERVRYGPTGPGAHGPNGPRCMLRLAPGPCGNAHLISVLSTAGSHLTIAMAWHPMAWGKGLPVSWGTIAVEQTMIRCTLPCRYDGPWERMVLDPKGLQSIEIHRNPSKSIKIYSNP